MKKMLQIISSALFISFITFPTNASAQMYSDNQEGFVFTAPVVIVSVISFLILVGFTLSLLDLKKDLKKA